MKTRIVIFLTILVIIIIANSCEKEKTDNQVVFSEEELNNIVEGSTSISQGVQTFMYSSLSVMADSGHFINPPSQKKSLLIANQSKLKGLKNGYDWMGPDFNGWYSRYWNSLGYKYSEKVRFRDTIDYIIKFEYNGGDGNYSNTTTTQYIKYKKNDSVLYKGYSNWEIKASGYNEISQSQWKIVFEDWNPNTSAGIYDWYWGVSQNSGGNTVPLHRYEHLKATEAKNNWLHVRVICYDDRGYETWDFEYDTPWAPIVMPELPENPAIK